MSPDSSVNLHHPDLKGVNPGVAVLAAIALSCCLVAITHLTFNRSAAATNARNLSKQTYEKRKAMGGSMVSQADPSLVIADDVSKLSDGIDEAIRSVDQGASQLQPDDLSDKSLGLN